MPYEIKKKPRLKDTLTLTDDDKGVKVTVDIDLDLYAVSKEFRQRWVAYLDVQKAIKKAEKSDDVLQAYEEYGRAFWGIMAVVFGAESAKEILSFFSDDFTEAAEQILPFIYNVVIPALQAAAAERTNQMRQYYRNRRKHRKWVH